MEASTDLAQPDAHGFDIELLLETTKYLVVDDALVAERAGADGRVRSRCVSTERLRLTWSAAPTTRLRGRRVW
jgi:hypothetical protein